MKRRSFVAITGALLPFDETAVKQTQSPATASSAPKTSLDQGILVELFTSQGCSSCPPADAELKRLSERVKKTGQRIYPLSFHVDYWNDLGWRDPYSHPEHSRRQRQYASAMGKKRIYTPQMIVDGVDEFVGSDSRALDAALRKASTRSKPAHLNFELSRRTDHIQVAYRAHSDVPGTVFFALVQEVVKTRVTRGENSGQHLQHSNVVRVLRRSSMSQQGARLSLPTTAQGKGLSVIGWIQKAQTFQVLAATTKSVKSESG